MVTRNYNTSLTSTDPWDTGRIRFIRLYDSTEQEHIEICYQSTYNLQRKLLLEVNCRYNESLHSYEDFINTLVLSKYSVTTSYNNANP